MHIGSAFIVDFYVFCKNICLKWLTNQRKWRKVGP